jgi:hypothetical protein
MICFSVIKYVSLTGFRELRFYPVSTRHHTYKNEAIPALQGLLRRRIDSHFGLLMSVEAQRAFGHRSVIGLQVLIVELPQLNGFLPQFSHRLTSTVIPTKNAELTTRLMIAKPIMRGMTRMKMLIHPPPYDRISFWQMLWSSIELQLNVRRE